jgi:selenocysteine lyase/cysteine desulfurase
LFTDGLRELPGWRLLGVPDPEPGRRVATFGLLQDHASPQELAKRLGDSGYYTWNGNFYALNLVRALELDEDEGMLRIGFAHYNTADEVTGLLELMGRL